MPILEWQDKFNLGIDQFDVHHRHLVVLLNSTYDHFVQKQPLEGLGLVLDALSDYAIYHFSAEERWMEAQGYDKLEQHRAMHEYFKKKSSADTGRFSQSGQ